MSELPKTWTVTTLVKLLSPLENGRLLHQGWSPKCEHFPSRSESTWGVLKTTAIQDGRFEPEHNKELPSHLEPRPDLEVKQGDLLLTCAGPRVRCGVACLVEETRPRLLMSGKMYRMRVDERIAIPQYVESALRSPDAQTQLDGMKTGISESGMNLTHARFATLTVPVAPLAEQQRIADKLDSLLSRVDSCRERLDRVPSILKRFRQSVLAAATSGKLTEDWREEHGLNDGWRDGVIADLLVGKPRNGYSPRGVDFETKTKSLTLTATTSGRFLPEHFKYIDEEIPEDSHLWLEPDDILIQRANTIEYVGVSVLYDGPKRGFIYPDLMMKVRANQNITPRFLNLILLGDGVRNHFRANATGTAGNMPKINQQTVLSAPVRWPCINEQHKISHRVDDLLQLSDSIESRYNSARRYMDRLTPSLLAKAFRGELVPQDPDDEPASVLLERIRAAKPEATKRKPKATAK